MALRDWREHILWPSLVGQAETERPVFVGPNPAMQDRRDYMYRYLWWTIAAPREWFDVNRPGAERVTANFFADHGHENFGRELWEFVVDNTLWNMACSYQIPTFPWQCPSNTAGGESETYLSLKIYRRAEIEADAFLNRLAQR